MRFGLLSDLVALGANVTFAGLTIVFTVLIVLVLMISLFGKLMSKAGSKKEKKAGSIETSNVAAVPPAVQPVAQQDEGELIAVIAAAVSTMYEGTNIKPVIKSVKPSAKSFSRPIWAMAGIYENTKAF
ncbi:MAG: OadG family protein [Oscillospiraceae bacterium]